MDTHVRRHSLTHSPTLSNTPCRHLDTEVEDCEAYAEEAFLQCSEADPNCVVEGVHSGLRLIREVIESNCTCTHVPSSFGSAALEHAEEAVRWTSVGILSVFVLDGLLHMLEMGLSFFTESHGA